MGVPCDALPSVRGMWIAVTLHAAAPPMTWAVSPAMLPQRPTSSEVVMRREKFMGEFHLAPFPAAIDADSPFPAAMDVALVLPGHSEFTNASAGRAMTFAEAQAMQSENPADVFQRAAATAAAAEEQAKAAEAAAVASAQARAAASEKNDKASPAPAPAPSNKLVAQAPAVPAISMPAPLKAVAEPVGSAKMLTPLATPVTAEALPSASPEGRHAVSNGSSGGEAALASILPPAPQPSLPDELGKGSKALGNLPPLTQQKTPIMSVLLFGLSVTGGLFTAGVISCMLASKHQAKGHRLRRLQAPSEDASSLTDTPTANESQPKQGSGASGMLGGNAFANSKAMS